MYVVFNVLVVGILGEYESECMWGSACILTCMVCGYVVVGVYDICVLIYVCACVYNVYACVGMYI